MVEGGVDVNQRRAALEREAADDAADGLVQRALHLPGLGDAKGRRDGDLHERHAPPPIRMSLEEALEAEETLGNPFGVVESVDAQQDHLRGEGLAELPRVGANRGVGGLRAQAAGVDADGQGDDAHLALRELNASGIVRDRKTEEVLHAIKEVSHV